MAQYGLDASRRQRAIKAAIIREKGTNGERETVYHSIWQASDERRDDDRPHQRPRDSGRHQHDRVLRRILKLRRVPGLPKVGQAHSIQPEGKEALDKFYAMRRHPCHWASGNGCQLMGGAEPHQSGTRAPRTSATNIHEIRKRIPWINIPQNESVMFGSLSVANKLGLWVAPERAVSSAEPEDHYNVIAEIQLCQISL